MEQQIIYEVLDAFQDLKPGANCEGCKGFLEKTCPAIALLEKTSLCMGSTASAASFLASAEAFFTLPQNAINRVRRVAEHISKCRGGEAGIRSFTPGHSMIAGVGQPGFNACVADDFTRQSAIDAGLKPSVVVPMSMESAR